VGKKPIKQCQMVVVAIPCLNVGGTEIQTLQLVKVLTKEQYNVRVLCYFEYQKVIINEFLSLGCKVDLLELSRQSSTFKILSTLVKYLINYKPDYLHVQYIAPGLLPIFAARLARIKIIFATVHQPYTKVYHGYKSKILLRISAKLCTKFISVSENAEKSWFKSSLIYNPSKINNNRKHFTIYNAIDIIKIDEIVSGSINCALKKM
jgi:hypothetical protein